MITPQVVLIGRVAKHTIEDQSANIRLSGGNYWVLWPMAYSQALQLPVASWRAGVKSGRHGARVRSTNQSFVPNRSQRLDDLTEFPLPDASDAAGRAEPRVVHDATCFLQCGGPLIRRPDKTWRCLISRKITASSGRHDVDPPFPRDVQTFYLQTREAPCCAFGYS